MKNSAWREYQNGVRWLEARRELRRRGTVVIENAGTAAIDNMPRDGETLKPKTIIWVCRWCQHGNPIGLFNCEDCGMVKS